MKLKSSEVDQTKQLIEQILATLEKEYQVNRGKTIPLDNVYAIMQDLLQLITNYADLDVKDCCEIIKTRYIPLIKLLTKLDRNDEHRATYLNQLENAYRLGAKYDFACFLVYYEWDNEDKIFEKRYSILHSYVYFLNQMAHDDNFELIIANLPSGYGKTRIVKLYEAWRLGLQPKGTHLALCSNDAVVKGGSRSVIDIIKTERFGLVFPNLSYQIHTKDLFLKETDGEWKVKDCALLASYYASTVNSNVVGQRASLSVHIDDLYARPSDALDEKINQQYLDDYLTVWRERFVKGKKPQIIISGTMWSPNDFIVKVIDMTKDENKFIPHPKFKYTFISEDGKKAIIQVPALDPDTDKSTCEDLVSTAELHKKRREIIKRSGAYLWETNFQQNPTTPEGLEFDWKNIETYEVLPTRQIECAYAVIDGTRKSGKDFFSMPIFYNHSEDKYSLVDCIFTKVATSELIDDIVSKIIEHHIVKLVIESNVDGGLKRTLEEKLHDLGVYYCVIIEKYNTAPKAMRIEAEKGKIKNQIIFPDRNIIDNLQMNKFMENFTLYNSSGRNANDDAPDSVAMFTSEIIGEKSKLPGVKPFKRFI